LTSSVKKGDVRRGDGPGGEECIAKGEVRKVGKNTKSEEYPWSSGGGPSKLPKVVSKKARGNQPGKGKKKLQGGGEIETWEKKNKASVRRRSNCGLADGWGGEGKKELVGRERRGTVVGEA